MDLYSNMFGDVFRRTIQAGIATDKWTPQRCSNGPRPGRLRAAGFARLFRVGNVESWVCDAEFLKKPTPSLRSQKETHPRTLSRWRVVRLKFCLFVFEHTYIYPTFN